MKTADNEKNVIRRNCIVSIVVADGDYWSPFSRVIRLMPNNRAECIFCNGDIEIHPIANLEIRDYKGYWERMSSYPRFVRMPTLRKLKQRALSRQLRFDREVGDHTLKSSVKTATRQRP